MKGLSKRDTSQLTHLGLLLKFSPVWVLQTTVLNPFDFSQCLCLPFRKIERKWRINQMIKKYYLETFGCQMNVVDSEQISGLLEALGYEPTTAPEAADLILLNTCTIRERAERKVVGHLWQFKPLKEANPELIIAVGGCVAQQEGGRLLEHLPHVDVVFGTHNIHRLPEMIEKAKEGRRCQEVAFLDKEARLRLFPERRCDGAVTQFVTIMQGCDNFCAYCVVPHVRGPRDQPPQSRNCRGGSGNWLRTVPGK